MRNLKSKFLRAKKLFVALEGDLNLKRDPAVSLQDELKEFINLRHIESNSDFAKNSDYLFLRISDLSKLMLQQKKANWRIETSKPIAIDSNDHLHPRGVRQDETRKPAFVMQVLDLYGKNVSYLDLGCAGGGLVYDFVLNDCLSLGIEGSDYSLKHGRAYWREVPWALKTADITAPLRVFLEDQPAVFDVIGAWEFLEHIDEKDIPMVLDNVKHHLKDKHSIFLANIATFEDSHEGTHWHKTIQGPAWWAEKFNDSGLEIVDYPFDSEFNPRGSGNTLGTWGNDYNIKENPNMGFSIAARLK
jgi:2-polyprenyl-3-methyl-5-hydroxy-6-metoxy-1,4-benzoquinol methylase